MNAPELEQPCPLCAGLTVPLAALQAHPTLRPFCSRCGAHVQVHLASQAPLESEPP